MHDLGIFCWSRSPLLRYSMTKILCLFSLQLQRKPVGDGHIHSRSGPHSFTKQGRDLFSIENMQKVWRLKPGFTSEQRQLTQ